MEALVAVDGGVDFAHSKKTEPIVGGNRYSKPLISLSFRRAAASFMAAARSALRVAWRDCSRARFFCTARFNRYS